MFFIAGVLITGGYPAGTAGNQSELYLPSSDSSCTLPSLPDGRYHHTYSEGGLLCGGRITITTAINNCLQWRPDTGSWERGLYLDVERYEHVSWTPASGSGTYLMGGYGSRRTTTIIKPDMTEEEGFPLKNET